jgi:hypothetical protein
MATDVVALIPLSAGRPWWATRTSTPKLTRLYESAPMSRMGSPITRTRSHHDRSRTTASTIAAMASATARGRSRRRVSSQKSGESASWGRPLRRKKTSTSPRSGGGPVVVTPPPGSAGAAG